MKNIYFNEIKRAFSSTGMKIALLLGSALAVWDVAKVILPLHNMLLTTPQELKNDPLYIPEGLYNNWMGVTLYPVQSYIFYMIIPLLAVLPFGGSFYDDRKSGYIKNVCIRTKREVYYKAKYIAVFLSGGIAIAIPLMLNLMLSALLLPALKPDNACNTTITGTTMAYELFYTHPLLYSLLFILIDFIFGGVIATIALSYTYYTEYKFGAMIAPFVLYFFLYSLMNLLDKTQYSLFFMLNAGASGNHVLLYLFAFLLFFLLSYVLFMRKGKQADVL